jgi:hypothetical protein
VLAQQVETAQFLGAPVAGTLAGELVCYGRSVIHSEWPRADAGTLGNDLNPWGVRIFETVATVNPRTPAQQAAYGKFLDQTSDREAARNDRIHGAVGVIPLPLWVALLFISVVLFIYTLFFADSGEGALTQAVLMGSIAAVMVVMLLLIRFLDSPFREGVGGVRPVAMERTLDIVDQALRTAKVSVTPPCDANGNPVG